MYTTPCPFLSFKLEKLFERKIVYIFLPICLNVCSEFLGVHKDHFIEMVLLSTHNI